MADFTREQVVAHAKKGGRFDRADLASLDLSKITLDGLNFRRAELDGANLEGASLKAANLGSASLREAFLASANLSNANLEKADLEGANLKGADLSGAILTRANLEGADLEGANLSGATLSFAQLDCANLGGADLRNANIAHADLEECYLGGAKLHMADLTGANLKKANIEEADLSTAILNDVQMVKVIAAGAKLVSASMVGANLIRADLTSADLSNADLREANLQGATVQDTIMTGARVHGIQCKDVQVEKIKADWLETSEDGRKSQRASGKQVYEVLSGQLAQEKSITGSLGAAGGASRRYFGEGDVLRDAALEFGANAVVEIASRFEKCDIVLKEGAQLVLGPQGVMEKCRIQGAGHVTIHGFFSEGDDAGIVGAKAFMVSEHGRVVSTVEQHPASTHFAFEPGCKLRLNIRNSASK